MKVKHEINTDVAAAGAAASAASSRETTVLKIQTKNNIKNPN